MSLIEPAMPSSRFVPGHSRSRSYNEVLLNCPPPFTATAGLVVKTRKRKLLVVEPEGKRLRTAPPLPPYDTLPRQQHRLRSLSPNKRFTDPLILPSHSPNTSPIASPARLHRRRRLKLPPIALALLSAPLTPKAPIKLKPITPTVSLDYLDTHKPSDDHWRYEVFDKLKRDHHLEAPPSDKPAFDLRISLKLTMLHPNPAHISVEERKINYPYELNYTYLNGLYLKDVEQFPEWREAAQLLIQLSQPQYFPAPAPPQVVPLPPMYAGYTYAPVPALTPPYYVYPTPVVALAPPPPPPPPPPATGGGAVADTSPSEDSHKFIPITPPTKSKQRLEVSRLPPKHSYHRVCISCGLDQLPCWRPSWLIKEGQLCNLCGLRYKKTLARCLNSLCKKIPAKGEWLLMQGKGKVQFEDGIEGYSCLECGWRVEVKK